MSIVVSFGALVHWGPIAYVLQKAQLGKVPRLYLVG